MCLGEEGLGRVERPALRDIRDIVIDTSLPREQRIENYVRQMGGNPYCYMDNGMMVCISYADTGVTLQDRLRAYACSLR